MTRRVFPAAAVFQRVAPSVKSNMIEPAGSALNEPDPSAPFSSPVPDTTTSSPVATLLDLFVLAETTPGRPIVALT